ncbi:uncharacterized protein, possibly involved in aromatic compounds catabolism [Desulfitobacterium dehalogenans ATCC 51507]|uniref:Uncharacterized protein, possibly involved in aromatic compounds catabolism n=2 Tax=Desulfitobacterium dehalogenans TaxID=36854 RepID=I4A5R9_DESDJ|nr:uncharacterized protein, possibly involved in aromatic compounds catabolism [Desulfitobacterium dehalogenans ATCC 51507]
MGIMNDHYRKLERMYLSAPINSQLYKGIDITISKEAAEIALKIEPVYFHAANAIHGSVYFKLLDDAAFFAVNSIVEDVFVYTVSFNTHLLRPISKGIIKAIGQLKFKSQNLFISESTLYDDQGKVAGFGTGNFMKSKIGLTSDIGYK